MTRRLVGPTATVFSRRAATLFRRPAATPFAGPAAAPGARRATRPAGRPLVPHAPRGRRVPYVTVRSCTQ
ncbi:hypothetical protein [Streptomyces lateritius]|uniref:hypothetical protein n=1 Tax=Streptomyces lateritius TaxID=67313 RepID=UPI001C8B17DB|nr:hypothetical protein [Streptomyces lateritius]MBX9425779.1 hypothetical protein [Streptomyces lateritius]